MSIMIAWQSITLDIYHLLQQKFRAPFYVKRKTNERLCAMVFPYCSQIHIPAFHIVLLMARHMDKKKLRSIFFYDIHNYTCIIIAWAVHDKVSVQGQSTILSHEDWIIDEAQWQNAHMTFIFHGQLCFMGKLLQWKKRHPRLLAWMKHLSDMLPTLCTWHQHLCSSWLFSGA